MLGYYFHTASWNLVIGKLHYCACKSKRGSMRGVGVKCQDLPFEISPLLNSQGTGPPPPSSIPPGTQNYPSDSLVNISGSYHEKVLARTLPVCVSYSKQII